MASLMPAWAAYETLFPLAYLPPSPLKKKEEKKKIHYEPDIFYKFSFNFENSFIPTSQMLKLRPREAK